MRQNISVLCSLFLLFSTSLFANYSLTLEEALRYAVVNNKLLQASIKSKLFFEYELKLAKGKNYPNIFLEASANKINEDIVLKLGDARSAVIGASIASFKAGGATDDKVVAFKNQLKQSIPNFDMKFQNDIFYNFSTSFTWPLYTGGKISANTKAKQLELEVAKAEYEKTLNSTITSVIESYFKAKLAQESRDIRKEYLENIKQHATNAQKLFEVGMISKTNKLIADVALSQATREYQKSERDFQLALVVLSNIIGKDTQNSRLTTDFNKIENLDAVDYYGQTALSNNITLKNMQQQKNMINQKIKALKGDFLPTIVAFGKYEIYKENLTTFDPQWIAGINAKLNIFNGGSDYNEYKAYSAQLEIIDLYIEDANKSIDTAVKKYHHDAETAHEQYESLKSSQDLTEENLKLYRQSFKEGLATSIEVIDAELALEKVKLEQSQALFNYNVTYAKLMDICGKSQILMDNITGDYRR